MANIFNDLNKLVNTVQKVDKLLTEKPKRKRIKPQFDAHLRNLIEYILKQPADVQQKLKHQVINNLNEI